MSLSNRRWLLVIWGFPGDSAVKNACQCRRGMLDPCVGKIPIPGRRKWKPTLVFLPGKFHEQRILVGYSLWGHKRVGRNIVAANNNLSIYSLVFAFKEEYVEKAVSVEYSTVSHIGDSSVVPMPSVTSL